MIIRRKKMCRINEIEILIAYFYFSKLSFIFKNCFNCFDLEFLNMVNVAEDWNIIFRNSSKNVYINTVPCSIG